MEPCPAVHRTILVVDVERFGDRRRTNPHQVNLRNALYEALQRALAAAGIPWETCRNEDRGDGVLVLAPAEVPKAPFVDTVPRVLAATLREHNQCHPLEEQIRLRMALHAGEVQFDNHGVTGASLNLAFRLLDAQPLKTALADSPGVLALVVSGWFFEDVVRHSLSADPGAFRPARVAEKETSTVAWIALPDHPYPADPTALINPPPDPAAGAVPQQLPSAPGSFTGRRDELTLLTATLNTAAGPGTPGATVVISAIGGAGGIGKTTLALHWARNHLHRFPDGQMYVDLRGFDPSGHPAPVGEAIRGFLDALGVNPATLPVELDAQAARYRSLVAGKRMLIVLDNARDIDQVTPLLPGSPTCTVLVTTRRHLAGLAALQGAHLLNLDVLPEPDARELLARHLGDVRLAAEPQAVAELLAVCAGLPLAVAIVAARARHHPTFPLAVLAEELRDVAARLDGLDAGNMRVNLRAVLSWSFRTLSPQAAALLGLLGIAPGPDISLPAAATLAGQPSRQVRTMLRELEDASLIQERMPGRYRMHDLIRLYAADHAHAGISAQDRERALKRLINFCLHAADAARRLLYPYGKSIRLERKPAEFGALELKDETAAIGWFDVEHPCLLAAQKVAADYGWHRIAWQLAWTLHAFHRRRGHVRNELDTWQLTLAMGERLQDPVSRTWAHRFLAHACVRAGLHAEAMNHMADALTATDCVIEDGRARREFRRALDHARASDNVDQQALSYAEGALCFSRVLDDPLGEADALTTMGWLSVRLGDYRQARYHCELALSLFREYHDEFGEAQTLDSLGYIAHQAHLYADAQHCYYDALAIRRAVGDIYGEAVTLNHLGETHLATGQSNDARAAWKEAVRLYQAQHLTSEADRILHQLDSLHNQ